MVVSPLYLLLIYRVTGIDLQGTPYICPLSLDFYTVATLFSYSQDTLLPLRLLSILRDAQLEASAHCNDRDLRLLVI